MEVPGTFKALSFGSDIQVYALYGKTDVATLTVRISPSGLDSFAVDINEGTHRKEPTYDGDYESMCEFTNHGRCYYCGIYHISTHDARRLLTNGATFAESYLREQYADI